MGTKASTVSAAIKELVDDLGSATLTTTATAVKSAINELDAELGTITAAGMGTTAATVGGAIKEVVDNIGDLSTVTVETATGVKATSVVAALNQLETEVSNTGTASAIKIQTATTATTGMLKTYEIVQGKNADNTDKVVGKIDIPKDFLVKSASVVKDPTGQPAGTYIDFVVNSKDSSATDEHIYLDVKTLCDVYSVEASAAQIQLAISSTNEISAEIVDGSVDTDALKDDAVTAAKIADDAVETAAIKDAQVTAAKLAANSIAASYEADGKTVKSSTMDATTVALLQKAHDAVQAADISLAAESDITALFPTA